MGKEEGADFFQAPQQISYSIDFLRSPCYTRFGFAIITRMEQPNIFVISDYGAGDPAFAEVVLQLRMRLPNAFIYPQSTPPFSTLNTGFWIYQIALTKNIQNTYIYSNTAPRKERKSAQVNNKGEKLMYAKLDNDFELIAVNAGYTFSFVKPHIKSFHFVDVKNEGSQFRSRDIYPAAVAAMVSKDERFIRRKADKSDIPNYPKNVIASIDGYGNIKTTTRASQIEYKPGQPLIVNIHNQKHLATYTNGMFNIKDGELAFAPGSSGHTDRFMELFLRGGNAYKLFNEPMVEEPFTITLPEF